MTDATIEVNTRMLDALSDAEHLAYQHQDLHAVVYRLRDAESGRERFEALLSTVPAPDRADVVTTVTRRPPEAGPSDMTLRLAVRQVVQNLPEGIKLADVAVVEHYPQQRYSTAQDGGVFCYQFLSTEGLNVATWIPDTAQHGALMQMGFEGRGRVWHEAHMKNIGRRSIGWMIEAAMVKSIEPGLGCSAEYNNGWKRAEDSLMRGTKPDDFGPTECPEEVYSGWIARMAKEQEIRAEAAAPAPVTSRRPRP